MDLHPLTLPGRTIRLEPLALAHVPDLTVAGRDPDLWRFMPYPFDGSQAFGERECLRGGLGQFEAMHLMTLALANAGRLAKFGA